MFIGVSRHSKRNVCRISIVSARPAKKENLTQRLLLHAPSVVAFARPALGCAHTVVFTDVFIARDGPPRIELDGESVVSSWRRIAPWCCLVRWCRGKYIADKSWFLLLSTSGPHLLELSLILNLLELVDGRCFFKQSTLDRDVMENTVQAGTPAKESKYDVEQDIE